MNEQLIEPRGDVQTSWLPAVDLLAWLPDETLHSILSRQHQLSGALRPETIREQFFGHQRRGGSHDLPTHLDYLVDRTQGAWGDAASIIGQHTILPYYLQVRSESNRADVIQATRAGTLSSVKTWLGLLEQRFNRFHPLKACIECMALDRADHGVAYWHRAHQWPGSWWCIAHDLPLHADPPAVQQTHLSTWRLPDDRWETAAMPLQAADRDTSERLRSIATISAAWARDNVLGWCGLDAIVGAYRKSLSDHNWITPGGEFSVDEASASFAAFIAPLAALPELTALPISRAQGIQPSERMRRRACTRAHPFRHVVTIAWLFGDWQRFIAQVATAAGGKQSSNQTDTDVGAAAEFLQGDDIQFLTDLIAIQDLSIAALPGTASAQRDFAMHQRDLFLSEAIVRVCANRQRRGFRAPTTKQLVGLVPELAIHLIALDLLPLTRSAIKRAVADQQYGPDSQAIQFPLVARE